MQWDDLRYVLAVHRTGSAAGAARTLKVSNVTVFRRIEGIEKQLGVRLFDRRKHGYVATPVAVEIVQQAELVEEQINALERRVWRQDSQVHGTVRITTTDTIAILVLPAMLARLRKLHPELRLEISTSYDALNITKRDADIAIRYTASPPEMLIGHRLTPVAYAVYGAKALAPRRRGKPVDLARQTWVTYEDKPVEYPILNWIRQHGYEPQIAVRFDSYLPLVAAMKAGVGVGLMSCFTAESLGGLVRLSPLIPELELQYWILTHPELRDVARVATVYAFLRQAFAELQPLFAGKKT